MVWQLHPNVNPDFNPDYNLRANSDLDFLYLMHYYQ